MFLSPRYILSIVLASKAALGAAMDPRDTTYCTFYTEDMCENRSGHVNYATNNDGIFQNGGPYFSCHTHDEFSLISYPRGDSNGDNPNYCHVFSWEEASDGCTHLDDLGFTTGDGGYYRITLDKTCPTISKRDTDNSTGNDTEIAKRNGNYLAFFNDPDCEDHSGSVDYSTDNQGCFENGGAYASFGGDDFDWHIEQYSGTGDYWCTPSIEACVEMGPFSGKKGLNCVHLDSVGLKSGTGSYKIGRHGCP